MIKDNKASKYLLYAIGEIVLVVIGILIALQINNWNKSGKASIQEANFLTDLLGDTGSTFSLFGQIKTRRENIPRFK